MIITIYKIRLLQIFRLLKDIGLFRIIILFLLLGFISIFGFNLLRQHDNTPLALILIGLVLLSIHATRKDKQFLKILAKDVYLIYLCEYLFLIFPFLIIWLIYNNWIGIGLLLLICILISLIYLNLGLQNTSSLLKLLINPFSSNLNFKLNIGLPFISCYAFEWKSGIRRNFFVLVPVYLLFLSFSFRTYVAPVGLIFLSIIISGFYLYGEPREFIELYALSPKQFILRKLVFNLKYLIILFMPILLIAVICQPATWYYLIGAIIISILIQVISIIFKYALFEENISLSRNSIIVFLNILFIIVPLFWLVPLIMGIKYYIKAQNNLKEYFHA